MKRTLICIVVSALVFGIGATLVAPSVLGWYFEPPGGGMVMMQANTAVTWGIKRLIEAQLTSLIVGAVFGLFLGIKFRPRVKQDAQQGTLGAGGAAAGAGAGMPAAQQPVRK